MTAATLASDFVYANRLLLVIERNLAINSVVARLNRFESEFKTGYFLSCIGYDRNIRRFSFQSKQVRSSKFYYKISRIKQNHDKTHERFVLTAAKRGKEGETFHQYITASQTLAQTCDFCAHHSLNRRLPMTNDNVQKKLLQDPKHILAKAIDICRSSKATR